MIQACSKLNIKIIQPCLNHKILRNLTTKSKPNGNVNGNGNNRQYIKNSKPIITPNANAAIEDMKAPVERVWIKRAVVEESLENGNVNNNNVQGNTNSTTNMNSNMNNTKKKKNKKNKNNADFNGLAASAATVVNDIGR